MMDDLLIGLNVGFVGVNDGLFVGVNDGLFARTLFVGLFVGICVGLFGGRVCLWVVMLDCL